MGGTPGKIFYLREEFDSPQMNFVNTILVAHLMQSSERNTS